MDSDRASNRLAKLPFAPRAGVRRILLVVTAGVALFAGAVIVGAMLAAPWVVDRLLAQFTSAGPERSANVASVRFNPLTLAAELTTLRLQDERAHFALRAGTVIVDLDFRSLLGRHLRFQSILVESPSLELESLRQILDFGERISDERLEAVNIERLEITNGRLATKTDDNRPALQWSGIAVALTDYDGRTGPPTASPAHVTVRATTTNGGRLESDGFLEAGVARTTGRFTLTGFELETMRRLLESALPVTGLSGTLDLTGDYVLTAPLEAPMLEIANGHAQIRDFALSPVMGFTARADEMNATANLVFAESDGTIPASGRIEITDARLALEDARVAPPQSFEFADAAVLVSVNRDRDRLSIDLDGDLIDAGYATMMARIPTDRAAERTLSFGATDLPAARLSSYAAQDLGRGLSSGRFDIDLAYALTGPRVNGDLHVVAREFAFSTPADGIAMVGGDESLDLAAALLVNADDVIDLHVPFAGNARSVRRAAADALRARIATLTRTPFDAIAPLIAGEIDTVRSIPFLPGDAALGDPALAAIDRLAAVLTARPRLGVRVHGGFDANADRTVLARQQIQLHVLLATAGPSAQARPQPVDFDSARAQDVLDEFAGERLPAEQVEGIAALFDCRETIASLCRRAYYAALFDALVAREEITDGALNRLGRFRSLSIVEALTQRGVDPQRLEVVTGNATIDNPFGIGLPVELIVAESR